MEDDGLLHIVGEEVTTPGGHANVWDLRGARQYVDFRVLPGDPRIADLVKAAQERGALFVVNHPSAACLGCAWEHAIPPGVRAVATAAECCSVGDRMPDGSAGFSPN